MTQGPDRDACDLRFPGLQALRLIRREIERTRLDLTGLRVLTEAAVGYRRLTPAIAALAGADQVYAVGRDSAVASRRDAEEQTAYFAGLAHVERRLTLLPTRLQAPLRTIDVVTDLPGVRPVDESVIRNVADTAAVTLMAGVDRWRPSDTDAATCRRQGVAVAGLDEEAVGLHRFTAQGVLHALLELGVEITGSSIMVAGEARALPYVVRALTRSGDGSWSRRRRRPGGSSSTGARRPATRSTTTPSSVVCPRPTPWCSALPSRGLASSDPVRASTPSVSPPRRPRRGGGTGCRRRSARAGERRPAVRGSRRTGGHLRSAAPGADRPMRGRTQGRRGDDTGATARLVAARGGAARRRRGARRAAAPGPARPPTLTAAGGVPRRNGARRPPP